jgi:hypothetical protein
MAASQAAVHRLLDIVCNAARDSNLHIADDYAVRLSAQPPHYTVSLVASMSRNLQRSPRRVQCVCAGNKHVCKPWFTCGFGI